MNNTADRLVALLDLFAEHTGRSVSTVSRHATGSGDTVARLRRGGTITTRRLDRTIRFLSDNWPDSVEWPADIPRPASSRADRQMP
jgi:hypothetical protein